MKRYCTTSVDAINSINARECTNAELYEDYNLFGCRKLCIARGNMCNIMQFVDDNGDVEKKGICKHYRHCNNQFLAIQPFLDEPPFHVSLACEVENKPIFFKNQIEEKFEGKLYIFRAESKTVAEATHDCLAKGMKLVSIENLENGEMGFLATTVDIIWGPTILWWTSEP